MQNFNSTLTLEGLVSKIAAGITEKVSVSLTEQLSSVLKDKIQEERKSPVYQTIDGYCRTHFISKPTFHRLVNSGKIKVIKEGKRTLIPANEL